MRPETAIRYGFLLLLVCLAGCVPFVPCYYVYPSVSCVPSVAVDAPKDEIHAFRVDIAEDDSCLEFMRPSQYRLTPMQVWPGGRTCPQVKAALDHGWIWNCVALSFGQHSNHTVRVRLYRQGYALLEVSSWELPHDLHWMKVNDLTGQEKAVDDLLAPVERGLQPAGLCLVYHLPRNGAADEPYDFGHLRPLWFSQKHRQALAFAVAEYEHVAAGHQTEGQLAACERCLQKAARLRTLMRND